MTTVRYIGPIIKRIKTEILTLIQITQAKKIKSIFKINIYAEILELLPLCTGQHCAKQLSYLISS